MSDARESARPISKRVESAHEALESNLGRWWWCCDGDDARLDSSEMLLLMLLRASASSLWARFFFADALMTDGACTTR
ncbi:hypothetical protein PRIC2_001598 [Phytophthora ramorum]